MSRGKMRGVEVSLVLLVGVLMIPTTALAQSAIAGTVTDTTGAVLPGVTVEARSPALIEQLRAGVTDGQGQYRIIDLRPGVYSVTFALTGFNTVVREGIDLPANFTAPVSVQMRVGALEETVTVSGASPLVDVQSTQRREVMSQELIRALPTGRTYHTALATLPAVRTSQFDVGGSTQMENGTAGAYGGAFADQIVTIDGMNVNALRGNGSISAYIDTAAVQEYVVQVSGAGAEAQTGGIQINMVPRTGSNRFEGMLLGLFSVNALKSNNISNAQLARGIRPFKLAQAYDVNGNSGGPIFRNKLWYFGSSRVWAFNSEVFNLFHTGAIQGKPKGTPVVDGSLLAAAHARLTGQLSPKNKLTGMYERDWKNRDYMNINDGNSAPEAAQKQVSPYTALAQAKWTSTMTNRLLLEVGWSFNHYTNYNAIVDGLPRPTSENPFVIVRKVDLSNNIFYGGPIEDEVNRPSYKHYYIGSVSYVTGSHAFKGGVQFAHGHISSISTSLASMTQRYLNGKPNSVILQGLPTFFQGDLVADLGLYVQDSWTRGRLTLNPGLRYDYSHGELPVQSAESGRWVPARSFPAVPNVPLWKDITPRFGAAYDLFGTGKTAIKGSVGTYLFRSFSDIAQRYNLMFADSDTRDWNDLNGNDIADPNEFGPSTNRSFGTPTATRRIDPNLGRERNTLYHVSLDHELRPGLSVSIAYIRRTYADVGWLDNLATTFDDYTLLSVPDPRGNGQTLPVYNISAAKRGVIDQIDTTSDSNTRLYNGVDVNVHGRLPNGAQFSGGVSSGSLKEKMCEVDDPNGLRFCDQSQYHVPFRTTIKASGTYPLPWGFQVSAVYQGLPGAEKVITYPVTRTLLPALTVSSQSVRLNEPGSEYLGMVNQLDISLGGTLSVGGLRVKPQLDLFNTLNASPVLLETTVFGSSLGTPRQILYPRLLRFGARVEF